MTGLNINHLQEFHKSGINDETLDEYVSKGLLQSVGFVKGSTAELPVGMMIECKLEDEFTLHQNL